MNKPTSIDDECVIAAVLATKASVKSRALSHMLDRFTPSQIASHHIEHPPTLQECERMADRLELTAMNVTYVGARDYPTMLLSDPSRSPVLFWRGDMTALQQRRVGVVGTRSATAAGRYMASHLSFDLAERGIAIVSGLARGVDAWAHKGVSVAHMRKSSPTTLGIPVGVVA